MKEKIDYSFSLSVSVCEELDEISHTIKQNALNAEKNNLLLLKEAWRSDASTLLEKKYSDLISKQKEIAVQIERESETVRAVSRRLYLIEKEAEKTVSGKGTNN